MQPRTPSGRAARRAQHAFPSRRRRPLFLEPLEARQLLATLAVPISGAIFDTASAVPHAEAANLLAELSAQGHAPQTFTDLSAAGMAAALAAADAIVVPEQEFSSLLAALSSPAQAELAQFVADGHGMIVLGSPGGRAEALLGGLFGFSLVAGPDPTAGASFLKVEAAEGTALATGPVAVINSVTKVTALDISLPEALPAGTKLLYTSGSVATIALFPYGQGQVLYFGYDFDSPAQSNTAAWKSVLGLAIEQVAAAPPTTSVELVGGDLVIADLAGRNDGFSLAADDQQWVVALTTGSFTAPAAIPGVSLADASLVIDKLLATTFTGRFAFHGGGGDDLLTVTLDQLDRPVLFDGGESTADHDLLRLVSVDSVGSVTCTPDNSGGGSVDIGSDGIAEIVYAGLEPVDLTGAASDELHFVVPAGVNTAALRDYLEPTDGFSQLTFGGAGPEDHYFRHPSHLLAVHTAGDTTTTLFPLDPTATIPELLLDGTSSDLFVMGATSGIRSGTSLTLVEATLDLSSHSPTINGLSGDGSITNSDNTNSVLTIGASGGDGDYTGTIRDGLPPSNPPPTTKKVGLLKAGDGAQRLAGANTYSGTTEVAAGELVLDGSVHEHSAVTVRSGAVLVGSGSIEGSLAVEPGGQIDPGPLGAAPGIHQGNEETWQAGSQFAVQLGGTTPGSGHDQRRIGGSLSLAGALLDVNLIGGFLPTAGSAFTIVDNFGSLPIDGTFDGLPEGAEFVVPLCPLPLFITYEGGDGNDVVLFSAAGAGGMIGGTAGDDTLVVAPDGDGANLKYSLNGGAFVSLGEVENLEIDLGAGVDRVTFLGEVEVGGDLAVRAERIEVEGPLAVGGELALASAGLLRIDGPVVAQGPVTLTTSDAAGVDADLAIAGSVTSVLAGLVLASADHLIVRGPLSAATTIDLAIDEGSFDPEGNTLVLQGGLTAPGGTTIRGNGAADRFEIEPQTGSTLWIDGGGPAGAHSDGDSRNARNGDESGDTLVLDLTTAGDGSAVAGPVVVDSVGGRAVAENTRDICYENIENLDLLDGGTLTTAQQGDLYVRGTDADERIYVAHDGAADPRLRISVQGRMFPEDQTSYGPYVAGRSVILYGRGGRDVLEMSSAAMRGELHGEAGDDYLAGGSHGDLLIGGPGSDVLIGGTQGAGDELWGDDFDPIPRDEIGQPIAEPTAEQLARNRDHWARLSSPTDGHDRLSAAGGNDRLYGQGGDDQLYPAAGDDYASGGSGNDLISGGDGNDRLYGNDGNDTISGDGGDDLVSGGAGNDLLLGQLGNDLLLGGGGGDFLLGHDGDDLLLAGIVTVTPAAGAESTADSVVAGDAADQAMLALLLEWSTLAQVTGVSQQDDGAADWLFGLGGRDRFASDGTSYSADFAAGVDEAG